MQEQRLIAIDHFRRRGYSVRKQEQLTDTLPASVFTELGKVPGDQVKIANIIHDGLLASKASVDTDEPEGNESDTGE